MSILEQKKFISSIHPFQNLTINQIDDFVDNLDIAYLKKMKLFKRKVLSPEFLFFFLKGLIQEKQEDEVLSIYSKKMNI